MAKRKRGRPRLGGAGRVRSVRVLLTAGERAALERLARAAGVSMSDYLRKMGRIE